MPGGISVAFKGTAMLLLFSVRYDGGSEGTVCYPRGIKRKAESNRSPTEKAIMKVKSSVARRNVQFTYDVWLCVARVKVS